MEYYFVRVHKNVMQHPSINISIVAVTEVILCKKQTRTIILLISEKIKKKKIQILFDLPSKKKF